MHRGVQRELFVRILPYFQEEMVQKDPIELEKMTWSRRSKQSRCGLVGL